MTTEKSSSATCEVPHHDCDEQQADGNDICTKCGRKAIVHIRSRYFSGRFVRGRKGLASISDDEVLDLHDKILPSSCASSHPEIRYQGAECPLCEALKRANRAEGMVLGSNTEARVSLGANIRRHWSADDQAMLGRVLGFLEPSRPSSDPGAGEVGK